MRPPWRGRPDAEDPHSTAELAEDADAAGEIVLELTDVLDLHSFPPREIGDLVRDYLDVAVERGWPQVRIVHGKGAGVQRERVRSLLAADPRVDSFGDAPGEAGGWGATWARLRPPPAAAGPAPRDDR
jgi:dsDNA-specific endonuclease/ATPase MutS2